MLRSSITALCAISIAASASTALAGPGTAPATPHVDLRLTRDVASAEPVAAEPAPALAEPAPPRTTIFGLPRNVGPVDRVLRTVIGVGLAGLGAYGLASDELSATTSGILLGVSAIPLLTAATAYCPLYQAFGIDESF